MMVPPLWCALLMCVFTRHQVIALLASALHAVGNSKPDVVRQLLDLAVLLLREGNVDAVLSLVRMLMLWCYVHQPPGGGVEQIGRHVAGTALCVSPAGGGCTSV